MANPARSIDFKGIVSLVREAFNAAQADGKSLGAGCPMAPGAGGVGPGGRRDMRRDDGSVEWLIPKSPRLALARALQIDMIPFEFTISTSFSAAGPVPLQPDQGPNKSIGRDVLLYGIDIDIQTPSAYTGDELKSLYDFFYAYTSGIQGQVNMYGQQRRIMSYAPLRAFNKYCSPDEPWVVTEEQIPSIDFNVTTPLPFAGTTITVTFVGKTPATDTTFRMSDVDAFDCLEALGYWVAAARKIWSC